MKIAANIPFTKAHARAQYMDAVLYARFPDIKKVIEKYPEAVHWTTAHGSWTALHAVVRNVDVSGVEYLLTRKAPLNAQNKGGETALMVAVVYGNAKAVNLLIAAGARLDLENNQGCTARQLAQSYPVIHAILEQAEARQMVQAKQRKEEKRKNKDAALAVFTKGLPRDLRTPKLKLRVRNK